MYIFFNRGNPTGHLHDQFPAINHLSLGFIL